MIYDSITQLSQSASTGPVLGTVLAVLSQKTEKTTRTGKPYLELSFADVAASITIKVWDNAAWHPACAAAQVARCYAVTANWSVGNYGIEAAELDLREATPEEEAALMAGGSELRDKQQRDWESIAALVDSMTDPRLRELCREALTRYGARFRRSAAARGYHHARRGGLVEHVAGVMRCGDALCRAYPELNRDLVLAGCFFHDIGKLWENCYNEGELVMPYSLHGELLGHIPLGIELVNRLWGKISTLHRSEWEQLEPPAEQVRLHLLHLIAAHHGELQFGSPVVPKTPEALAVHYADNIDAKLEMFRDAYTTQPELADGIHQRRAPLPGNEVAPLPPCGSADGAAAPQH